MKQHCETLVVGATMTGLGFAAAHPDALVIEAGELPAPEWVSALVPSGPVNPAGDLGKWLAQKLTDYKALERGALDVQRLSPALCKALRDRDMPLLLLTRVVDTKKTASGYEVEVYNNGGISVIHAKNILDTTVRRLSTPQAQIAPARKIFHVLCGGAENPAPKLAAVHAEVSGVREPNGLWNVAFTIDPQWEIAKARALVINTWEQAGTGARIAIMASVFEEAPGEAPARTDDGRRWLPARGAGDPVTEFEAGGAL